MRFFKKKKKPKMKFGDYNRYVLADGTMGPCGSNITKEKMQETAGKGKDKKVVAFFEVYELVEDKE